MSETKEKIYIGFSYGVLCDDLQTQAKNQNYFLENAEFFEDLRKALNLLSFHILNESEKDKLFQKLHKKVVKSLKKLSD